jgi:hypothetical protein
MSQSKRKKTSRRPPIYTVTANGYRDQLDRTRRFLERVEVLVPGSDVHHYQDDVWAFFQSCWNLRDWIQNELRISDTVKKQVHDAVESAHCLKICYDLANGVKHYALTSPKLGARHLLTNTRNTPGEETIIDCVIELPDGSRLSARKLARECLLEWERILQLYQLPIERIC